MTAALTITAAVVIGYLIAQAAGRHHDRMLAARRADAVMRADVRAAQVYRDAYNAAVTGERADVAAWDAEMREYEEEGR